MDLSRRGASLVETLIVLALAAVLVAAGVPAAAALRARSAVRAATTELVSAIGLARTAALAESRRVAVRFDTAAGRALVIAPPDTLADLPLGTRYAVRLHATRDSIAYGPTGRGWGAANATVTLTRGAAADTISISRLGRLRH